MLDIIILSKASDEEHFTLVKKCVESFLQENEFINSIIIVESNKQFDKSKWDTVSPKIKTIIPPYQFNYNQFLNIGIENCTAEIICISNSDVQAKKGCIQLMLTMFDKVAKIASASPVDRTWHQNSYNIFPQDNQLYVGYDTTKFLLGFCIFFRKSILDTIGPFDERFNFYHQDNDYEMCLRRNDLLHVMNTFCHIIHGHGKPASSTTEQETHSMLRESQNIFLKKWNSEPYNKTFAKYKKLTIVSSVNVNSPANDFIQIVDNIKTATGQYVVESSRFISSTEQELILNIINFKPSSVVFNDLNIRQQF